MRTTLLVTALSLLTLPAAGATYYVTVAGLGGEPDYEQRFTADARELDSTFRAEGRSAHVYTLTGTQATAAQMTATMEEVARQAKDGDQLVLTLIGHGSFDGTEYKFNLVGPDLTAGEIAGLCDRIRARRQLIVDTTSASGGSVQALERSGRGVIAATKSGTEKNATVFARFWVESLEDPSADADKNDSVSALEAFLYASKKTAEFYDSQKRLATEHAVFEDAGRGEPVREAGKDQGALLRSFTILLLGKERAVARDPKKAELLQKKEGLEQKIDQLKLAKAAMDPEEYRAQLTQALVELAKVQEALDQ